MRVHELWTCAIAPLQQVQRRRSTGQVLLREMEVTRGGAQAAMPEQTLDGVHISAGFEQMGGKGVAQRMNAARFGDAGAVLGGVEHALCTFRQQRVIGGGARPAYRGPGLERGPSCRT